LIAPLAHGSFEVVSPPIPLLVVVVNPEQLGGQHVPYGLVPVQTKLCGT
jgi:hypothetical protein